VNRVPCPMPRRVAIEERSGQPEQLAPMAGGGRGAKVKTLLARRRRRRWIRMSLSHLAPVASNPVSTPFLICSTRENRGVETVGHHPRAGLGFTVSKLPPRWALGWTIVRTLPPSARTEGAKTVTQARVWNVQRPKVL